MRTKMKFNKTTSVKRICLIIVLFCASALLILSCQKDEPNPTPLDNTLVISPMPVFMGMVPVDHVKAQRSVILFNSGSKAVQVSDFSITGEAAGAFTITNSPSKNIDPIESVVIDLEYDPSASGEESAVLKVNSNVGSITDNIFGIGTTSSDKIEFLRINSVQDQEGLSYGIETADNGLIFIGTNLIKATIEHTDLKVLKTDKYGAKLWEKTYGGDRSETAAMIVQTSDGAYVIGGSTESFGVKNTDMYLLKIDGQGNEQWSKTYGGDNFEDIRRIVPTGDGGFLLFGTTREFQSDVWIVKVNSTGVQEWEKTLGGEGGEAVGDVLVKSDNSGYLFVGRTTSQDAPTYENTDVWLVEIDNSGNTVTEKTYGSSTYDIGVGLVKTSDGGYIISGTTVSEDKARQAYLLKLNPDYSLAWEKSFGNANNDSFGSVRVKSNGDILAISSSVREATTEHSYREAILYKIDSSGTQIASETFTGSKSVDLSSLEPISDGGYVLCGSSDSYSLNSASVIVKISANF